jgi:hypothetical protein
MNLIILLPVALIVAIVIYVYYSRRGKGGSGLDERHDSTEPRELRGPEQWKDRHGAGR